jgi:hypothetical protein
MENFNLKEKLKYMDIKSDNLVRKRQNKTKSESLSSFGSLSVIENMSFSDSKINESISDQLSLLRLILNENSTKCERILKEKDILEKKVDKLMESIKYKDELIKGLVKEMDCLRNKNRNTFLCYKKVNKKAENKALSLERVQLTESVETERCLTEDCLKHENMKIKNKLVSIHSDYNYNQYKTVPNTSVLSKIKNLFYGN